LLVFEPANAGGMQKFSPCLLELDTEACAKQKESWLFRPER
jgi:hypothetical protein